MKMKPKTLIKLFFLLILVVMSVFGASATTYPYWIEHDENGNPINYLWIKVNLTANQPKEIWVYYGNDSAPSYNNGDSIFEFFDDFDGSSLDTNKWSQVYTGGSLSFSNSIISVIGGDNAVEDIIGKTSFVRPIIEEFYGKLTLASQSWDWNAIGMTNPDNTNDYHTTAVESVYAYKNRWIVGDGSGGFTQNTNVDVGANEYHHYKIVRDNSGDTTKFYKDGVNVVTITQNDNNEARAPFVRARRTDASYPVITYVDWIFVRKYSSSEPSVSVGDEETGAWTINGYTYTKRRRITITSTTDLTDYQVGIPISELPFITSKDEPLYITDQIFKVGINQNISYDEFKVNHNITHSCYWQNVTVNVTEANLTLIAINVNDSVTLYNITFENVTENQTISHTYTLQQSDAHDTITFQCVYTDYLGDQAATEITLSVENTPPTAPTNISVNPEDVKEDENISVIVSGSTDVDGDSLTYYYSVYDLNTSQYIVENITTDNPFNLTKEQLKHDFKIIAWAYDGYNYSDKYNISWHDKNHFYFNVSNVFVVDNKTYADTINVEVFYRCLDNLSLVVYDGNNTIYNNSLNCSDDWQSITFNYRANSEGNKTIIFEMKNDSYLSYNDSYSYIVDLEPPNVSIILNNTYGFRNNITESFKVYVFDNISYNVSCKIRANNQNYSAYFNGNETKTFNFNFTDGNNEWFVECVDFVNHTTTKQENLYIYVKNITLINEETAETFNLWSDMYSLRFVSSNYTYNFLEHNNSQIYYVSTLDDTIRLEKRYKDDPSTILFIDLKPSLIETNTRVCVAPPQQFYEILLYSSTTKPVAVINNYANCYVLADYTQYAYQDAVTEKIYTIKAIYYLYTYENNQKVFLASIDGGTASQIALDILESQKTQYVFSLSTDTLTIQKVSNSTLRIHYKNIKNDNVKVIIKIKDGSNVVFQHTETEEPNEFTIYFDYSTLSLSGNLLTFEVTKYKQNGEITTFKRLFNLDGSVGIINPNVAILLAIVMAIFALTFVAINYAFGWFGMLSLGIALAITTLAPSTAILRFFQMMIIIVMVYVAIIWKNEYINVV